MKIHALTCCVNYADFLTVGAKRWMHGLESWTIVTDLKDRETARLAKDIGAKCFQTNVFYERGAAFNKGAALEAARIACVPWEDWFLLIDADIVPEEGWYYRIASSHPQPGAMYSAFRYQCDNPAEVDSMNLRKIETDAIGMGYFQLAHTSDAALTQLPILETCWKHAGVYDSHYAWRWAVEQRRELAGLRLMHLGEKDNWFGRGNKEAFKQMNRERLRRGGYQHERIES